MNKPTRKEQGRFQRWLSYLRGSKLTEEQIKARATQLTEQGRDPEF